MLTALLCRTLLQDLRLENGVALIREKIDPRLALGGAINALGSLMLTNTVVRDNRAINGGGLYTEGDVEVHNSRLERNLAHQCGGAPRRTIRRRCDPRTRRQLHVGG